MARPSCGRQRPGRLRPNPAPWPGVLSRIITVDLGPALNNRYRLEAEIGRGASGVVYRAVDQTVGTTCAVKVLLPWAQADDAQRHRLRREARLAALLRSPHAVAVHELCEGPNGELALVMELLYGQ